MRNKISIKKKVLIYGAGAAGKQLAVSLKKNQEFRVIGFLDDDKKLKNKVILNYKIYPLSNLKKLIFEKNISVILLAIPSIGLNRRNQIIKYLNQFNLVVKTLPSISQIVNGRITVSDIKDLNIEDLLNREQVEPEINLLNKNINKKTVVVTGAWGSIGSDLCRQIIKLNPKKLLLLELNEFALYKIYEELKTYGKKSKIISLLADALDQTKLEIIFEKFKVDTVYHSAAYKHVPLVEENICSGVKNNVFSTLSVVNACVAKKFQILFLYRVIKQWDLPI